MRCHRFTGDLQALIARDYQCIGSLRLAIKGQPRAIQPWRRCCDLVNHRGRQFGRWRW
jgi:hypothetical protein